MQPVRQLDTDALALTFDDGPDPLWTPRVLDALADAEAKATFFVIAGRAAAHQQLLGRMLREGHTVGVHCAVHERQSAHDATWARADIAQALDTLVGLMPRPVLWRTPWGDEASWTRDVAREQDLRLTGWTIDTHDWRGDSAVAMAEVVARELRGGDVVLAHDGLGPGARRSGCAETVTMIHAVASTTRARGKMLRALAPGTERG